MSETPLVVEELTVAYGDAPPAVRGISLRVEHGELVALLGRNGAGKTSSLRGIVGFLPHEGARVGGTVSVAGRVLERRDPLKVGRAGVVLVPERDKVFPQLTVESQLRLVSRDDAAIARMSERFPALSRRAAVRAGLLSGGERQMLALALALLRDPQVLLVDELSLGLAPVIVYELMTELRRLADETGIAVLLVDQAASVAVKVADQVLVLDRGVQIAGGAAEEVDMGAIQQAYLGQHVG
jgi:branched-chain amino acid transport system ATP-binding protein